MDYTQSEYLVPIFDYGVLHLELNTAIFILALFAIVTLLLNMLLFRPVLRTLDARAALVTGVRDDNARKQAEIDRLTREYETRMDEIRAELDRFRQDARRDTAREVEAILSRARESAEQKLSKAMGELEAELGTVRSDVLGTAGDLARHISQRILERR
jgi:F-type H+-transporting ATPase subunit b